MELVRLLHLTATWMTWLAASALAFCENEKAALFEDCSAFDDSRFFGGAVCGSDGATYPNWLYVRCVNYRSPFGGDVHVSYRGPCTRWGQNCPYSPLYKPVCATDEKTYANVETLACLVTLGSRAPSVGVLYEEQCEWDRRDPCLRSNWQHWGLNPVCSNNGLTYPNIAQFRCLQNLHPELEVVGDGGCSVAQARTRTKADACWMARNRYEWNPICGSDNITYPNPFILLCYQPDVKPVFQGECNSPTHLSCLRASDEVEEEEAVCGSNGSTFPSLDHLLCASAKDKYLWPEHKGACTLEDDPCQQREWYFEDVGGSPVCASDGRTYVSPSAVWCTQRNTNPCLKFVHDGPCILQEEEEGKSAAT